MRRVRTAVAFGALVATGLLASLATGCGGRDASQDDTKQKVVTIGARDIASVAFVPSTARNSRGRRAKSSPTCRSFSKRSPTH